ncbi:MAG: hypothetical protein KGJ95_07170, partial [Candidatus Omnitrophica bacterium]|nr:hypothetical protein [Candidatus Omnitrophota bacterium]
AVIAQIETDQSQKNYFFQKVKDLKWFYYLKERNYFSPDKIPYTKDNRALFWNVLDYLERVSEQLNTNPEYGKELMDIIIDVVVYSRSRKVDNYHIWWFFVKIINNIPNSTISQNLPINDQSNKGAIKPGFLTLLNELLDPSQSSELAISDVSEKLLPKFLNDSVMITYAEAIIDCITRVKPKGVINTFTKEDEVVLVWNEYWILKSFIQYAKLIGANCTNATIFSIADHLKSALQYTRKSFYVNLNIGEHRYQFKVERVIKEDPNPFEIRFQDNAFKGYVLQYSEEQLKGIDVEKDFWSLHKIEPTKQLIPTFTFKADDQDDFIKNFEGNLPKNIDWRSAVGYDQKINGLFGGINEDYSSVWCKSLSDGPEHISGAEEVLTVALRDCLLGKCEKDPANGGLILKDFLSLKYPFPIFKKCALICINKYWSNFHNLLIEFLNDLPSSAHSSNYETELYDILKDHNSKFSPAINERLLNFIDDVPEYYDDEGEEAKARWRFKWLSPLKDNPFFAAAYKENFTKAKLKEDASFIPERSSMRGGFVKHVSPITVEEIITLLADHKLVGYLNEYVGADEWSGSFEGKPDKEGLKETLRQAVKENPGKFSEEILLFKDTHYAYVNDILWGLKDAWNEGKYIAWDKLFDFCLEYINRGSFTNEAKQAQGEDYIKGRHLWIIDSISELIGSGSRSDEKAFDPKFFPKVYLIYDRMLMLVEGGKNNDNQRDAVNYAINTSLGHVTESFIIFSLRVARAEKRVETNWGLGKYERFMQKGEEAYTFLGRYLPQFNYLDKGYTKIKIDELVKRNTDDHEWQGFMEGYLTGPHLYLDLYKSMREHYLKVIEHKFSNERIDKRMVEHVTMGYLNGIEGLDDGDSLFRKMLLDASSPEKRIRWEEAVSCLWARSERSLRDDLKKKEPSKEFKNKVLEFWSWLNGPNSFAREKLGDAYNAFLGKLLRFTIFLDSIDSTTEKWLMSSVTFIEQYDSFFIEYLTKFKDEPSVRYIGNIFLKLLEATTPIFKEEDIKLIIERLYQLGEKDADVKSTADAIVSIYGKRNIHFLKSLWFKYHK